MGKLLLIALAGVLFAAPVFGVDSSGHSMRYGLGMHPCSAFTASIGSRPRYFVYKEWTAGFITASDMFERNTNNILSGIGFPGAMRWLKRFCARHPDASFSTAVGVLVRKLHHRQVTGASG